MKHSGKRSSKTAYFNISEVARILDVSPSTLRMWEKIGLVTPERSDGRYRLFTPDDIKRLKKVKFLKSAKHLNASGVLHVLSQGNLSRPDTTTRSQSSSPSSAPSSAKAIGPTLRDLRTQQGMTLKDVATRAGLSVGFLSSLERSQTNASIATLQKLAKLYNTNFLSFFDDSEKVSKLIRPEERKVLETQPGTRIELLALGRTMMETQFWRVAPGASSGGAYDHEGEEFIYVIQGRFEIWLNEVEHYMLRPGDSLYFPSTQSHRWVNPGKTETQLLWINTP
ncbi:MAG: MerR family transcriptional regulator [Acidobacteriota bacterium]|nr:MerR family transcriptional regulator [Acidobacteriota bacterium]